MFPKLDSCFFFVSSFEKNSDNLYKSFVFVLFLLVSVLTESSAQLNEKVFSSQIAKLRDLLFADIDSCIAQLKPIAPILLELPKNDKDMEFMNTALIKLPFYLYNYAYVPIIQGMLVKEGKDTTIMASIRSIAERGIYRNQLITALDVLENEYPYKIKKHSYNFSELEFYNIKSGQKIGDIGARMGYFWPLCNLFYDSLTFYTDVGNRTINERILRNSFLDRIVKPTNTLRLVDYSNCSTNMEGLDLDMIIFHNFNHRVDYCTTMLRSVKASIKPTGKVFVMKSTKELNNDMEFLTNELGKKFKAGAAIYLHPSSKAMSAKTIKKRFNKSGFVLVREMVYENYHFFEFKLQ